MTLEAGQIVDRYRLDERLEDHTDRDVHAGVDLARGRPVTVTVFHHVSDPAVRHELDERARQATRLPEHPHLAAVYDWGHLGDAWYIVTQPADGVALDQTIENGPLPLRDAVGLLAQIADALDAAHRHGFVHGAVNPTNIVVHRYVGTSTTRLVNLVAATGAPQRTGATPAIDQPVRATASDDRRGLAATAFAVLTGQTPPPPAGDVDAPLPSAAALNPQLPAAVDAVLADGLSTEASRKHATCRDFVDQLTAALPADLRAAVPPGGRDTNTAAASPARRRWALAACAAAIVAAASTAVYVATAGQDSNDPAAERAPAAAPTTRPQPSTTTASRTTTTATTTIATTTTVAATTTAAPTTTVAIGAFGVPVGSPITNADGPEAAYALALQQRSNPLTVAAVGSPAMLYAQWLRAATAPTGDAVTATANGFAVTADQPVTLQDFTTDGGLVTSFTECVAQRCTPITEAIEIPPQDCQPGPGCPHLRSQSGDVAAFLRATLFPRWPARLLLFELVSDEPAARAVVSVENPNQVVHYDADTHYLVILFDDKPPPGTRHQLTINFDDGTTDLLPIFYG